MMKKILGYLMLSCLMICVLAMAAGAAIPEAPTSNIYVYDGANLLSDTTEKEVLKIGKELDDKTKAQICVVTVKTLDGKDIESYANELFRKWGIGDKEKNNGVLLLISQDPRKIRIEVGYGLEGKLNDGKCGSIRDEYLVPSLKENDYDTGVIDTYRVLAIEAAAEYGETLTSVSEELTEKVISSEEDEELGFWEWVFIIVFLLIILLLYYGMFRLCGTLFSCCCGGPNDGDYWDSDGDSDYSDFGGGDSGGGGASGDY